MLDLGVIKPGSTIRVPFSSFDKDDGSAITMTNYAAADILIYKDGGTTERASTAGFTATTDFDGKTGKHLAVIDLADNTTAGFYTSGSEYLVAIDSVTIDGVTTGGWIARFRIGYPDADLNTTIASLSSQTSFTLTTGPAEDDALNGCVVAIHDIASAVQMGYAVVSDYTGSTKTVTLTAGVTFTAAAGDNIAIFPPGNARWFAALLGSKLPLAPTTAGRDLDVSAGGEAGIDWANVGSPTTSLNLSSTTIGTAAAVTTVNGLANNVITAAATAADFTTEVTSGLATAAELAKVPKSDGTATWNATALASIQSEANDALVAYDPPTRAEATADKDEIVADIAGLNNLSAAQVNAEVDTALADIHLDHLLAVTYDPASKPGAADALLNELVESDAGVARFSANALEQAPAGGGGGDATEAKQDTIIALIGTPAVDLATDIASRASQSSVDDLPTNAELGTALDALPTAAENATAVWGAGTRVLTAGTNIALAKGTGVTGFNDLSAAQVNAEVDTALADYDGPTRAEATADKDEILADLATTDGKVDGIKANTDKFANLPVLTAGGTGGQGYGAP